MHTRRRAFRAVNGGLVLMRSWSVNIVRFCGIVAKRSVVNRTKDYLQINIKAPPNVDPASTTKKVITLGCVHPGNTRNWWAMFLNHLKNYFEGTSLHGLKWDLRENILALSLFFPLPGTSQNLVDPTLNGFSGFFSAFPDCSLQFSSSSQVLLLS